MVVAESTVQFLLGWEIMGLCSFLLIGHWWEDYANARAALKAFFTVRVGDIGLLVGMSILFFASTPGPGQPGQRRVLDPRHLWLGALRRRQPRRCSSGAGSPSSSPPSASPASSRCTPGCPTPWPARRPVSALLHSSTMVVAGVYLVARLYPVFYEGFSIGRRGVNLIALIGGITIIIAAVLAFVQVDIKKVLAYSTVSQLGYMMMGLGVGAWTSGGVPHLHPRLLQGLPLPRRRLGQPLGVAPLLRHEEGHGRALAEDADHVRHVRHRAPLALAGLPPLAGFFSKDEIIDNAGANGYTAFQIVGLIGAFLTAAYMTRCVYLTFLGKPRGAAGGHMAHGDEEHEIDDDRVLVDAGVVASTTVGRAGPGRRRSGRRSPLRQGEAPRSRAPRRRWHGALGAPRRITGTTAGRTSRTGSSPCRWSSWPSGPWSPAS